MNGLLRHTSSIYKGLQSQLFPTADLKARYSASAIKLDGGTYYLEDLIGDKDIELTNADQISSGVIPYKSAITLTPPTGLTDVTNGFWYDGVTPNELYPQSFFNDIDYEHLIFVKTQDQILDGNGIEIKPSGITEILVYSVAKADNELQQLKKYCNVPLEDLAAKWVDESVAVTGDGSKSSPWKTITEARAGAAINDTVYVKSGDYDESLNDSFDYWYVDKTLNYQGLGKCKVTTPDASYTLRVFNNSPIFNNLILDGENTTSFAAELYNSNSPYPTFNKCLFKGNTSSRLVSSSSNSNSIFNDCNFATNGRLVLNGDVSLSANIYKGILEVLASEIGDGINIKNNKSITSGINALYLYAGVLSENVDVINNEYIVNTSSNVIFNFCNYDFQYNSIKGLFTYGVRLNNNTSNININNNIIDSELNILSDGADIIYFGNGSTNIFGFNIENNRLSANRSANYHVRIGDEATSSSDEIVDNININKNYVKGSITYGITTTTCHGLFVGFQKNALVNWNYLYGINYGIVLKGSNTTYTENGASYNVIKDCNYGILLKGVNGVYATNNTIVYTIGDFDYGIQLADNTGSDDASNCVVKNNIIISLGTGNNRMISTDAGTNNDIDYNIYYCPNGIMLFVENGTEYTFTEWQALGYDTNSIVLTETQFNNLFTDFDNDDFSINEMPINGIYLEDYKTGLDSSTDWGDSETVPSVVTKDQDENNVTIGAYVE